MSAKQKHKKIQEYYNAVKNYGAILFLWQKEKNYLELKFGLYINNSDQRFSTASA